MPSRIKPSVPKSAGDVRRPPTTMPTAPSQGPHGGAASSPALGHHLDGFCHHMPGLRSHVTATIGTPSTPIQTDAMRGQIARVVLLLCLSFFWANTRIDAVATGVIAGMLAVWYWGRDAPQSRPLPQRCLSPVLRRLVRRHDCRRHERRVRRHHRRQSLVSMSKVLMLTVFVIQVSNRPCTYRSTFRAHSKYFFYYDSTDWSGGRLFSAVRRRWGSHAPFISRDGRCYRARNSCSRHSEPEPPPAYEGRSTAIS